MDLTPEERERIYQEEKARLEARQLLETQMNTKGTVPPVSNLGINKDRSRLSSNLSFIGVTLLVIGIAVIIYFGCIFSVTVPVQVPAIIQQFAPTGLISNSVNNIGLISDRQNGLIFGGLSAFIGTSLLITGLILGLNSYKSVKSKIVVYSAVLTAVATLTLGVMASGGKNSPIVKNVVSSLRVGPDPNDNIAKNRLKQVGLAIISHAQDFGEKFPDMDTNSKVQEEITQYGLRDDGSRTSVSPEAFIDPSSGLPWEFNARFTGLSTYRNIEISSCKIIAYSPKPTSDGSRYCLFADGHYKKLDKNKWAVAVATKTVKIDPKLGFSTDYTLMPQQGNIEPN